MTQDEKISSVETDAGQSDVPADQHPQPPVAPPQQELHPEEPHASNNPPLPNAESAERIVQDLQPENVQVPDELPLQNPIFDRFGENRIVQAAAAAAAAEEQIIEEFPASFSPSASVLILPGPKVKGYFDGVEIFFERRWQISSYQFRKYVNYYGMLLLVNVVLCILWKRVDRENGDIYICVILVSFICFLITVFFERSKCANCNQNIEDSEICCCCPIFNRYETKVFSKQSQYVTSAEANTNFEHEVADISNIEPQDLPPIFQRHQDTIFESRSTDLKPPADTQISVAVDVHGPGPLQSPSCSPEGACGYTSADSGREGPSSQQDP